MYSTLKVIKLLHLIQPTVKRQSEFVKVFFYMRIDVCIYIYYGYIYVVSQVFIFIVCKDEVGGNADVTN